MGIKVEGVDELRYLLEQTGERAVRGVIDQMKEEGLEMRDLARTNAPVDEHNLEKAIKVRVTGGGRNALGQFARKSVEVYVDENMEVPQRPGNSVGDYAYIMHEHLTPYGPLQLGEKSQNKQAGQNETVGGKYLERAAETIKEGLLARLIGVARRFR